MIPVLLTMCAGALLGWLLIRYPAFHKVNNHLLNGSVYLLLFLLGISVGSNREVIGNLGKIGLEAIIIAVFSIAGSVVLSMFLARRLFRRNEK